MRTRKVPRCWGVGPPGSGRLSFGVNWELSLRTGEDEVMGKCSENACELGLAGA